MRTQFLTSLQFDNHPFLFSQKAADKIIVVYLPEKTDTLTIFPSGTRQSGFIGNLTHFLFHQTSNGKHEFGNLQVINLCEKVRLVFHRVFRCAQPSFTVALQGGGIMTGCRKVEIFPDTLFKAAEFDKLITHHVRIRCQSLPNFINGIRRHILPILLM